MSNVTAPPSFDLLSRPWLPVVDLAGVPTQLSLLDLIREAPKYGGIAHEDPLVVIATHRFVLAFLHRALDGPKEPRETAGWLEKGFPVETVEAYAAKWKHRFDLFDESHPFAQHPNLPGEKWVDHWSRLMAARGSFNTNFLYSYELRDKKDNTDSTHPAEAVLQLLAHQQFVLGGLTKRFVTSAKSSPFATACLTLVLGENLLETLCFNLVPYGERHNQEQPHWEAEPPEIKALERGATKPVRGLAESYTWNARSVRFLPDPNGQVQTMNYAEGLSPGDSNYDDPMICQILNSKNELYPLGFREGRGLWRDLHSFVPEEGGSAPKIIEEANAVLRRARRYNQALAFQCFGIVNNKAKISSVRQELLRLPPLALKVPNFKSTIKNWVEQVREEAYQLFGALKIVAAGLLSNRRNGASTRDVTAQAASFQADSLFWPQAETLFWEHIDSLPTESEQYYAQAEEIERAWKARIAGLKVKVFREVTNALEPTPETLRAINKAYRALWKGNDKE